MEMCYGWMTQLTGRGVTTTMTVMLHVLPTVSVSYLANSVQCFLATATRFLEEIMCWKRSVDIPQDHLFVRRVLY